MITIYEDKSLISKTREIITTKLKRSKESSVNFIVPESTKASVERIIMEVIREDNKSTNNQVTGSYIRGDVLSFIRLSTRILGMVGRTSDFSSDSATKRNVIYRVLLENIKDFKVLGKLIHRYEYIDRLIELLGDFSRYNLSVQKLEDVYSKLDEVSLYKDKLHDIILLINKANSIKSIYNIDILVSPLSECNKLLSSLVEGKIDRNGFLYKNLMEFLRQDFLFLGFGIDRALTPEEILFLDNLSSLGANIELFSLHSGEGELKLYEESRSFITSLKRRIDNVKIKDISDFLLEQKTPVTPLMDIGTRFSMEDMDTGSNSIEEIISTSFDDKASELSYIMDEIIRLTRDEGYRYRDIRILLVNPEDKSHLGNYMSLYDMESSIDERIVLTNTPFIRLASSIVELPINGYSIDAVLSYLRNPLTPIISKDVDLFENYLIKNNMVTGLRIFDLTNYEDSEDGIMMKERVLERVLLPIKELADTISREEILSSKARILGEYLNTIDTEPLIRELVDRNMENKALSLVRGINETMDLLASFLSPINNIPISQKGFDSLIRIDMRNKSMGSIPLNVDSMEVVTMDIDLLTKAKILFVLNATATNFPYKGSSGGILTREELTRIAQDVGGELPDKEAHKLRSEFIKASYLLSNVSDRIYFINDNKEQRSDVVDFYESYSIRGTINSSFSPPVLGVPQNKRHNHQNSSISTQNVEQLLSNVTTLSPTSLDSYIGCNFTFMVDKVLRIRPREDNRLLKPNTYGTILHYMLEHAVSEASLIYDDYLKLGEYGRYLLNSKVELSNLAVRTFEKYLSRKDSYIIAYERTDEFQKNLGGKAIRGFMYAFPEVLIELEKSCSFPIAFEERIGEKETSYECILEDKTFRLSGIIDRVDKTENGLRVVDYKTGDKNIKLKEYLNGVNLQLPLYVIAKNNGIEEQSVKSFAYLPIGTKLNKENKLKFEPIYSKLNPTELASLEKYTEYCFKRASSDIYNGKSNALVNHMNKTICAFCPYNSSCGNNSKKKDTYMYVASSNAITKTMASGISKIGKISGEDLIGLIDEEIDYRENMREGEK